MVILFEEPKWKLWMGPFRRVLLPPAAVLLFCLSTPAVTQWLNYPTPGIPRTPDGKPNLSATTPRLADGKPDLSGLWEADNPSYPGFGQVIQNWGKFSLTRQGQAIRKQSPPKMPCMVSSIAARQTAPFKIIYSAGLMVILYEDGNIFRQVFTDGRPLPQDPNPAWLGYSVGKWDGDTLIVDTTGFNAGALLIGGRVGGRQGAQPHSEALHITEHYRRLDFGHMDIHFTIHDSKVYTMPWAFDEHMHLLPDTELLEYICDENEKDVQHIAQ